MLAHWERICKAGLVLPASRYMSDVALVRRSTNATRDHTWSGARVNRQELLNPLTKYAPSSAYKLVTATAIVSVNVHEVVRRVRKTGFERIRSSLQMSPHLPLRSSPVGHASRTGSRRPAKAAPKSSAWIAVRNRSER